MIFESIIGHAQPNDPDVDWVEIDFAQTVRRALRLVSSNGHRIDILLPRTLTLHDGDIIGTINQKWIAIRVKPIELLRLNPVTVELALYLATELGNLHYPVEVQATDILTLEDGPVIELADRLKIPFKKEHGPFHPLRSSLMANLNR